MMNNYKIQFEKIPWSSGTEGLRFKELEKENKKLRLVELSDNFIEKEWCEKGHFGIFLEGSAQVLFNNGARVTFTKGDIITISRGGNDKHKAVIAKGEKAVVLFFEDVYVSMFA
jgi:hypothetical protein